jgi:hypothetical protein
LALSAAGLSLTEKKMRLTLYTLADLIKPRALSLLLLDRHAARGP